MTRLLTLLFVPMFVACTTTSVILAPEDNSLPAHIHFQPVQYESELTREHQTAIERVALAAIRNRGFLVSSKANGELPSVRLTVTTLRRDSVLAGHVNIISGRIEFYNKSGSRIAAGEHTESERGGLLFNSGQILAGITSELDNLGGNSFDDWIERFAMSLTGTLPKPDALGAGTPPARQPVIEDVHITKRGKNHEVCFKSLNAAEALLRIKNTSFPMRHIQAQNSFCVAIPEWLLSGVDYSAAVLHATSPFGVRSTQEIVLADTESLCSDLLVSATPKGRSITFNIQCGEQIQQCAMNAPCEQYTFRLYEEQDSGTFKLAGEFGIEGLTVPYLSSSPAQKENFRVFLLKGNNSFQKPVTLTFNKAS